jgi:hypothetical protein
MPLQHNTPIRHGLITFTSIGGGTIRQPVEVRMLRVSKLKKRIEDTALMCWAIKDGKKHRRLRRRLRALKGKAK